MSNELRRRVVFQLKHHHMPPAIHVTEGQPNIEHCADEILALIKERLLEEGRLVFTTSPNKARQTGAQLPITAVPIEKITELFQGEDD